MHITSWQRVNVAFTRYYYSYKRSILSTSFVITNHSDKKMHFYMYNTSKTEAISGSKLDFKLHKP